ncbi:hypothetical protein P256_01427 [Acinetobacter nectaris CIP 110549]|uniref:Uncharacterized protein n=1 Tax=Acinetobacter nectaris CIP 110549 TaxID=1392540 RepID=V2UVI0_9GAMM|nr:hypothetical protein P256_01427 [Acinetobacter nectaris CIP 110549]
MNTSATEGVQDVPRHGCKLIDHWMIDTLDVNEDVDLNKPELARVCVF